MDALTAFGLFAVTAMLVCYALEGRSPWWILGFAPLGTTEVSNPPRATADRGHGELA